MPPLALLVALAGCPTPAPDEPIVARFGGRTVTRRAFLDYVRETGPGAAKRARTLVGKRALLRALIDEEILLAEAEKRRLRHDPEVRDAVTPVLAKRLLDAEVEDGIRPQDVPEEEVRSLYRARHADFNAPARFRLGVIQAASRARADALLRELALVHNDDEIFEVLAGSDDNVDETLRAAAGNYGYFTFEEMRRELPEDLWPAFERLRDRKEEPEVVETARGVFIVMVTGLQPPLDMSFESVEPSLREEAFGAYRLRKIDEFVDAFRRHHRVTVNAGLLDRVPVLP